jgi:hypothetical protein
MNQKRIVAEVERFTEKAGFQKNLISEIACFTTAANLDS